MQFDLAHAYLLRETNYYLNILQPSMFTKLWVSPYAVREGLLAGISSYHLLLS